MIHLMRITLYLNQLHTLPLQPHLIIKTLIPMSSHLLPLTIAASHLLYFAAAAAVAIVVAVSWVDKQRSVHHN